MRLHRRIEESLWCSRTRQSHATLSNEERDALEMALNYNVDAAKLEEKQAQQATLVQQDTNETKN